MSNTDVISSNTCEVCYNDFNNSKRKKLECIYCKFIVCTGCIRTYMLTSHLDAHCMKCRTAWERDFWMDKFPKKFINEELKKHRETILYERELSRLPATQPLAEIEAKKRRLCKEIDELQKKKNEMYPMEHLYNPRLEQLEEKYKLRKNRAEIDFKISFRQDCINSILRRGQQKEERREFVRACPVTDCRGFLSSQWKCGICELFTCSQCHEIIGKHKDAPHTCDQNNIDTAKLLAKDTRPCPKCASLIFKISGCDQMFCTQCNTAFDWKSGRTIDNGQIHNPHYFEYLRQNPNGAPNQPVLQQHNQCEAIPNYHQFEALIRRIQLPDPLRKDVQNLQRMIYHNEQVILPRYQKDNDYQDLRIKYLLNDCDVDQFKRTLQINDKAYHKLQDLYRIIQLHITVCKDISHRLINVTTREQFNEVFGEFANIKKYALEQMNIIGKRYNCKTPVLRKFEWTRQRNTGDNEL